MGKTLFWIAVFFGVLLASRFLAHHAAKKRSRDDKAQQAPRNPPPPGSEQMVSCAHCGVFLPRSEALQRDDATWCSDAHATLGPPRSR